MASDPVNYSVYLKTDHDAQSNVSNVKLENSEKQPEISASVREIYEFGKGNDCPWRDKYVYEYEE